MQDFAGIWVPLVTPFDHGAVDHEGLRQLVLTLTSSGMAGVVVCGSTGEAAALDDAEQLAVLHTVLAARPGIRVIMGVSGVTPAAVAARLRRFGELGLAGVLVPPPSYVRPSQQGIADFFATVAEAAPCPLLLYDIPARTGVRIATATMLALAEHPKIRAVKDCSADTDHAQAVIDDGRLQLLGGDDHRMFTTLCQGGVGAIAASAHLRPDLFVALHRALQQSDLPTARRLWRGLWPLTQALFAEPSPGPLKAALAPRHGLRDELRAPMTRATPEAAQRVAEILTRLDADWPV
jgi:4-hydroxy-tetrahydrodipicolinate synthase